MDNSTELDTMTQMANELEDLGNLFEFGDIDLNNITDSGNFGGQMQQQHSTHPNTPFQDMTEAPSMSGTAAHDFGGHDQYAMTHRTDHSHQQQYGQHYQKHAPTSNPYAVDATYPVSAPQSMYQPQQPFNFQQQQIFPNQHVPPTPNSFEMHGESGRFLQQQPHQHQMDPQQRALMDQRYSIRKDDAIAFTPMASPAGTPQFNLLPEFTTPGAYFSPLTSPMLHAQQQQQHQNLQHHQHHGYMTNPSTAASSNTNSPIDPNTDVEMLGDGLALPESARPQSRKSRRKIATPRTAGQREQQKQASKSQKRKSTISNDQTDTGDGQPRRSARSQPSSVLQLRGHVDSSEAESISPEPLSEIVMGPPPRPGSVNQSPNIVGMQQKNGPSTMGPAATPKSLLTMRSSQTPTSGQHNTSTESIEPLDGFALPEAAATETSHRPSLSQINTQITLPEDDDTPRITARKTPKLGPLSTPSARPASAAESPAMSSPTSANTPSAILNKKDPKNSRGSKKRGSTSANGSKLVSPALVPKISPSIKPLLPEGTPLNSAQQAMLLASKSNYQNLVEGNRLPGVNYPDSLSTGLTSKRTSHKVAEQGRRNRINEALKEMQALIPKPSPSARSPSKDGLDPEAAMTGSPDAGAEEDKDKEGKEGKDDTGPKSNSSKAATVELANEYIKRMQKESVVQSEEMAALKRENEELRRRLAGQEDGAAADAGAEDGDEDGMDQRSSSASAST